MTNLILLDSTVADWLQSLMTNLLNGTDAKLQTSFSGVYQSVVEFSNGVVAVGLFISGVYLILQFLMTSQFDFSSLMKIIIMLAIYMSFTATVDIEKGSSIMAVVSRILDGFEVTITNRLAADKNAKIDAAFANGQQDGLKQEDERLQQQNASGEQPKFSDASTSYVADAISEMLTGWIFTFLNMIVEVLLVVCGFLVVFVSKFACWLLIAFAPFSVAISFIKGFEGSFLGLLKYFIVFKLWAVIVAAIKSAMFMLGFTEQIAYAAGVSNVSSFNSPSTGVIVMKLCYCLVVIMTPMFADILISGQQGGAFFSNAIGKAGGVMGAAGAAGSGTGNALLGNRLANIGKNFGHIGGALGAAKQVKDAGGPAGVVKGIKKMMNNPHKNDHDY